MAEKFTQPFSKQAVELLLLSLFFPQGAQYAASIKPQLYQELFAPPGTKLKKSKGKVASNLYGLGPEGGLPGLDIFRRFVGEYNPFAFLASNPYGRPGGPSQAEIDLMNRSLFGLTAPFQLGPAWQQAGYNQQWNRGIGPGQFASGLPQIFGALGGQIAMPPIPNVPIPQFPTPMMPQVPSLPVPQMPQPVRPPTPMPPPSPILSFLGLLPR